ncbi:MAG TPA: cytochrome c3 family protein [Acidobacteriaceae bacterium]|nr:cytochrome c3 family protein [Acidobacteriaceae bacterium]
MAQIFDRSSNALARMSLVLSGLIIIALGVTLNELQRSPWVTRQGQRADQPVPFSHKHHVEGLGLQCQYCHVSVEKSSYAGIPPTRTCMNCHSQIWTNAALLEPVRHSWATGQSIVWTKVHDLPDFVYFNHEIHVNKGIGCETCHGRIDEMPITYEQNSLQMEWCLNCHRDPIKNLRPTSAIYNMDWQKPSDLNPVWCTATNVKIGTPTSESVNCTTTNPARATGAQLASLHLVEAVDAQVAGKPVADTPNGMLAPSVKYIKFTNQEALGGFLFQHYHIRSARELSSCEVCHR